MNGMIAKVNDDKTTILTEDNRVIEMNSLFLPVKYNTGDWVELEEDKIVLRD
jgi:hypothetical protein